MTGDVLRWEPLGTRLRVLFADEVVAETNDAMVLHEAGHSPVYYVPDADVHTELLESSGHKTHCPWKGDASYWSLPGVPNAVWYYPTPIDSAKFLAGHVAFYPQHIRFEVGS